jgi:endonuclease G
MTPTRNTSSALVRLAACLWFVVANTGFAAEYRVGHCLKGCPVEINAGNLLLARTNYALSFSPDRGAADWLAYRMRPGALGIATSLSRDWLDDPDLPDLEQAIAFQDQSAEAQGLIRARLIPLVSVAATPYWHEANLLSASTLRSENLDRGAWSGLEWSLRNLVNRRGDVYVVTGPIYGSAQNPSRESSIAETNLPIAFFKLVATPDGALSVFRFDQAFGVYLHHCEARSTLAEIESETGLQFYPEWEIAEFGHETLDTQLGCR